MQFRLPAIFHVDATTTTTVASKVYGACPPCTGQCHQVRTCPKVVRDPERMTSAQETLSRQLLATGVYLFVLIAIGFYALLMAS